MSNRYVNFYKGMGGGGALFKTVSGCPPYLRISCCLVPGGAG